MSSVVDHLVAARERGERVAVATIKTGVGAGSRLIVWPGGEGVGDLGSPRLNQRVALYLETVLERRAAAQTKRFDGPGGEVVVSVEFVG